MSGIAGAALVVTLVLGLASALTWRAWEYDRQVSAAFVIGLPLSYLLNLFVKTPVTLAAERLTWPADSSLPPWGFLILALFIAPLTEEGAKLLPLGLAEVRSAPLHPAASFRVGMASGLGFGLGEAWYLAWAISRGQAYTALPLVYFSAYISERLVIAFGHGVMTSIAASGFGGTRSTLGGYVYAVALHALLNLGPLGYQAGLIGVAAKNALMLVSIIAISLALEKARRLLIT
ncbi:MAG: PrsW family glutamic-type intramembrane protease [Bacillota bacterium]